MKYVDEFRDGEVRPRRAEQGPRLRGCDPVAGCGDLAGNRFKTVGSAHEVCR
jgi:hypothetical protein